MTLATGKVRGLSIQIGGQSDLFCRGFNLRVDFRHALFVIFPIEEVAEGVMTDHQRESDVLPNGQVGVKRVVLEHHGNVPFARFFRGDFLPVQENLTLGDFFEARNHAQHGRFATTGRADEDDEFFFVDIEIKIRDGPDVAARIDLPESANRKLGEVAKEIGDLLDFLVRFLVFSCRADPYRGEPARHGRIDSHGRILDDIAFFRGEAKAFRPFEEHLGVGLGMRDHRPVYHDVKIGKKLGFFQDIPGIFGTRADAKENAFLFELFQGAPRFGVHGFGAHRGKKGFVSLVFLFAESRFLFLGKTAVGFFQDDFKGLHARYAAQPEVVLLVKGNPKAIR